MADEPKADIESEAGFYTRLPVFDSFSRLTNPGIYTPLPDDWVLGLTDVVRSTSAIEAGRYKQVNTVAASVIAAISNALGSHDFPFVFGGDGAAFALPASRADLARETLAGVAAWARDEFHLELRAALVSVAEIRSQGHDVRVARFAPSPNVAYAMFSGGGLAYAEQQMKAGAYGVPPAAPGTIPNLLGLSCRFDEIKSQRGVILSLIVLPGQRADASAFDTLIARVLAAAEGQSERPVPAGGPVLSSPFRGVVLEAKGFGRPRLRSSLKLVAQRLGAFLLFRLGRPVGGFDPARYLDQLVRNTDFRKFDDGLRMTLDCTPALVDSLGHMLAQAEREGVARYGMHRQDSALMTCFVPSPTRSDHIHFVDGAMGGYAMAARALKLTA
jgi:Protein of unknown function (DUF3095)